MKKVLFAGAAVIALAAASSVQAAEPIKLGLGGYMNQWVGYASNKDSVNGGDRRTSVDVQDDVQINFAGSTKLDNGLTVAVEVDANGSQGLSTSRYSGANKEIKRSFATVSGKYGSVMLGEQDNVGYLIHNSAPDVGGVGGQDGNWMNWVVAPTGHADQKQTTYAGDDRTENKIIYVTPAFYGVSAGFSYTPEVNPTNTGHTTIGSDLDSVTAGSLGDLYVYGLAYNNEFGDVKVKADFGSANANVGNLQIFQGGLNVSYAGFTVGGSFLRRNVGADNIGLATVGTSTYAGKNALQQGRSWDAGLSYVTGPVGVSFSYYEGKFINTSNLYDTDDVATVAASYDLGPGVAAKASVFHVDWDSNVKANQNEGWGAVTGLTVNF